MKHDNNFYLQLSREVFLGKYDCMSQNAKWLFVVLNELEQRFCKDGKDFFYRSDMDLASDAGMSLPTLKRTKAELLQYDFVQSWQAHFVNADTGKLSSKHITAYRILK